MPNNFLTVRRIARQALANLYSTCVMAQLVHRDYEREFVNGGGDTISIRKPTRFEAKEFNRAQGIEVQNAAEDSVDVTLNHFADVSFSVTSEDLALEIEDFDEQLLTPAMEAIAQKIDNDILLLRNDIPTLVGNVTALDDSENHDYGGRHPWSDSRVLIDANTFLTKNSVPFTDRRAVVGPETAGRWVAERTFRQADKRGSTEGLIEASLGRRVSGFDLYQTQNIYGPMGTPAAGQPKTETGIAFHRSALALVTRPLPLPRGAADAVVMGYKGFGLRVVYGYDQSKKEDVVSIDCLYGTKVIDDERAVRIGGLA